MSGLSDLHDTFILQAWSPCLCHFVEMGLLLELHQWHVEMGMWLEKGS